MIPLGFYCFEPFGRPQSSLVARVHKAHSGGRVVNFYTWSGDAANTRISNPQELQDTMGRFRKRFNKLILVSVEEADKHGIFRPLIVANV